MKARKQGVALIALLGAASVTGARKSPFTPHDHAYFQTLAAIEFIRPGLSLAVTSARVAPDGTISAAYTVSDPKGVPLDTSGVDTPGPIAISLIAAWLPRDQTQYVAYTTRVATGTVIASTIQAGPDSGGTTAKIATGQYLYTFNAKAPANFDTSATHTIGIYATRDLSEFNLGLNYASATFNFVPNGAMPVQVRDVTRTASCNTCHDQLSAHGGSRRGVELCVLCHTPQTINPNTGNTVDFNVMVHKIHMGSQLPSVIAGKPYQILPVRGGISDWSSVVYPADPRRCETCHSQTSGAKQATAYLTKPARATCGSCHDNVNFQTGANHKAGPAIDDTRCALCHVPQGVIDFDASIKGAHVVPTESALLSGLLVDLKSVTGGIAGKSPVVSFTLHDKSGNGVVPAQLGVLNLTMAGPDSDLGYTNFGSDVTTPGYVTESGLAASCDSGGNCSYTFRHPVPANATGTYRIGIEARRTETILSGTSKQQAVAYGAFNPVIDFSVDGTTLAPRRNVVSNDSCNACHASLTAHGGLRNNTQYCVLCHNPSETDLAFRKNAAAADRALPPQGVNFNLLVHRIHSGRNVVPNGGTPYVVIGFGGSRNDFSNVRYSAMNPLGTPGDLRNCSLCHINQTEQKLPTGLKAVLDPQGPINPVQAVTSSCTGCHVSIPAASHALSETTTLGESCVVCHGPTANFSVAKTHAQY